MPALPVRRLRAPARVLVAALLASLALTALPAPASAATWLDRRVINMTHQGGEREHPSGTMYALRESLALGADTLELDVQPTRDGELMVLHDQSVKRTTGVDRSVYAMTRAEVQRLDAARNFVPGKGTVADLPADRYPLRGVRTGEQAPPLGYRPDDFRIPTLEEVLRAFPDVPMNIEIKGRSDQDLDSFLRNARLLADLLKRVPHPPLIVVSFQQAAVDRFRELAPSIPVAPGITGVALFLATGLTPPGTQALQVPPKQFGLTLVTKEFVTRAHAMNQAVHVWFSGQEESDRVYRQMLDLGVDGMMPAAPRALERVLCERGVSRPPGNPNHCFGGAREAAARCAATPVAVSPVSTASGRSSVTVTLRRTEDDVRFACGGTVRLRAVPGKRRRGNPPANARLGDAPFRLPYGVRDIDVAVPVGRATTTRLRRAPRRVLAVAAAAVDGQDRERTRRATLRR
ncbi:glycerophosphodiester phosphodiesterase family protein [Patulibacter brassicae]|uniref:Glycerophosphodiester phosphodiesterase family protein n=1 Tax=Patulibacter brassicae TaxID=1705717 RepID=A0ABU4VLP2_9ACTN|nr:glycerophosphodiester phosphodiesterase family protein [Patulibacter brassicae]MDX8152771.1 glycerophosphodiester phosphodiesterase family protein [Patulibacter brassicae]